MHPVKEWNRFIVCWLSTYAKTCQVFPGHFPHSGRDPCTLGTSLPLYHHTHTHNYMGGVGALGPLLFPGCPPWEWELNQVRLVVMWYPCSLHLLCMTNLHTAFTMFYTFGSCTCQQLPQALTGFNAHSPSWME